MSKRARMRVDRALFAAERAGRAARRAVSQLFFRRHLGACDGVGHACSACRAAVAAVKLVDDADALARDLEGVLLMLDGDETLRSAIGQR